MEESIMDLKDIKTKRLEGQPETWASKNLFLWFVLFVVSAVVLYGSWLS